MTFEKVKELQPGYPELYKNIGESYTATGQFDEAVESFQKATQMNSQDSVLFYELALVLMTKLERFEEAKEYFKKSIQLKANVPDVHFQLGMTCIKLLLYKEAVRSFKEVIRIQEDHGQAHYQLGFCYAMLTDFESAKREYSYLLDQDVDLANTLSLVINP